MSPFALGSISYRLFDDGLANLLGLETLKHGTNIVNYIAIRQNGGDPSHGGKSSGSTPGKLSGETKGHFYVFKDSEFAFDTEADLSTILKIALPLFTIYAKAVGPLTHRCLSGFYLARHAFSINNTPNLFSNILGIISGICHILLVPTLHFRLQSIDHSSLVNDPSYGRAAYRTKDKIAACHIGLFGTLNSGINTGWLGRAKPIQ
jgi:hypothetical protein